MQAAAAASPRSLLRAGSPDAGGFLWAALGNGVYAAAQWGMVVALAKLAGAEAVGLFTLGLAVTAPIFLFTNLNLRTVLATDAAEEFRLPDYAGLRALSTALAFAVAAGIAISGLYGAAAAWTIAAVALLKAAESASDLTYGEAQRTGKLDRMAASLVVRSVLALAILTAATALGAPVAAAVAGIAAAWFLVWAVFDRLRPDAGPRQRTALMALARRAWPLGAAAMLLSFNLNLPRYFLERQGVAAVGIFSALSYGTAAGSLLLTALSQSSAPRLATAWQNRDRERFGRELGGMFAVALTLGGAAVLAALLWGREILTLLYRPEYAAHSRAFVILMLAAAVQYMGTVLGTAVTAMRRFAAQFPIHLATTAITLLLCPLWIPTLGIEGAAWVTLAGSAAAALPYAGLLIHSWRRA
jgi:O-antigen/teichoic acid export membrane protein